MSLSLSSLLNPSPDAETPSQSSLPPPQQSSASTRNDTLPPIQYVQSPEHHITASPPSAHPQHQYSYPPTTEQDSFHHLASLSGSSAPPPLQSPWYSAQGTAESSYDSARRSNSYERRPGSSGYGEAIQLPPPPSTARQNTSPTLDQYHVPSRSPDHRRQSMISPAQPTFTLPPIQSISPSQPADHSRRPTSSHSQHSIYDNPQLPLSRVDPPVQSSAAYPQAELLKEQPLSLDCAPTSYKPKRSSPTQLQVKTFDPTATSEVMDSSPAPIKQEALGTPSTSSPMDKQAHTAPKPDADAQSLKPFMKAEQTHSPLRDSSVPVPSTEGAATEPTASKKRPAPSKTKKGTATATKKAPPAKKRKVETSKAKPIDRSITPLKAFSSKGATPATSSPAPSTRSVSGEPDDDVYEDDEDMDSGDAGSSDDVYCLCRKPDTGTFMIGCDGTCDDWFHGKCVGIEERDKNLIDKYVCPTCTKAGAGQTTWKRMCRRSGCRQPARVGSKAGKSAKDGGGSKYCSDECGVMFFREMVARTRGKEELDKNRHSRRKNSIASPEQTRHDPDDDLGARGGMLAAGELKALVNPSKTADEFKKLGDGVLSPPATPDSKDSPIATKDSKNDFTESEVQALDNIHEQKDEARRKHQLLKERMKFVTMVKQSASRTATEKDLKPKEYCGYDSRIEWTETQFSVWRNGKSGRQAFDLETLATSEKNANEEGGDGGDTDMEEGADDFEICDRKKCARHLEWGKLAVDDLRFEMSDNSDRMRVLEREETEVRERAALRSKAGRFEGLGSVEVHGLGIEMGGDAMDVA